MLDELAIVRRAFNRIGVEAPQSFTEMENHGILAEEAYEQEAFFALELYPWTFAKELVQLSLQAEQPQAGFRYIHIIPSANHVIQVDRITNRPDIPDQNFTDYKQYGDKIHSNEMTLFAELRAKAKPHLWSAAFAKAVSTAIAGYLIEAIASDSKRANELRREAYGSPSENNRGGLIGAAMQADSATTPNRRMRMGRNPLTAAWEG